jgi:hypothetical protein
MCCSICHVQQNSEHDSAVILNALFDRVTFNPFNEVDHDNDKNRFFDDEVDDYCDTIEYANKVLNSCKYYDSSTVPFSTFSGSSFYFNNIDGFQSNFIEFRNQILNQNGNFDFYCFNETNLKSGVSHDFTIENYHSHFLHSIDGKSKGLRDKTRVLHKQTHCTTFHRTLSLTLSLPLSTQPRTQLAVSNMSVTVCLLGLSGIICRLQEHIISETPCLPFRGCYVY